MSLRLIATSAFGLEAVVVRELAALGYEAKTARPGRIAFAGDAAAVCRANLWLRSADRVVVELAEFPAADFDTLFDTAKSLPWEEWIAPDAAILVRGRSHKSQLASVPACQRTVKKAIVDRLLAAHRVAALPETGAAVPVEVSLVDDRATLDVDTTGPGLHRRGYRTLAAEAQLRETLAAALVQLSFWRDGKPLIDPFCGTGTIVIEAAMIGRNLAPGRCREFAGESFAAIPHDAWRQAREEAAELAKPALVERIIGWDASAEALKLARHHAQLAGVADDIHFQQREFADLSSSKHYGCIVTNPPYGVRLGEEAEITALYRSMPAVLRRLKTWSHFILSAREDFEQLVGQEADRRRKLYNGPLACTYYQFHGPRPKTHQAAESPSEDAPPNVPAVEQPPSAQAPSETHVTAPPPAPSRKPAFGGLRAESTRQAEEFANRLRARARHLRRWPTKRGITCYRLYERDVPDVPLVVDRFEDALHVAEFERPHDRTPAEHADWLDLMARTAGEILEIDRDAVFLKHRRRQRGASQYERFSDQGVTRVVHEGGLKFLINLSDYLDTGLFLDHRVTRSMVRDAAAGRRVLNLFAYTGSFSVYAAAGGAVSTTTVDLSGAYLDWAAENMRLNGFTTSGERGAPHRLVRSDAGEFLAGLHGEPPFDLAIVDPPTFSNSKRLKEDWDVQRDHVALLSDVLEQLVPGGVLFFSTNSRRFQLDEQSLAERASIREISRQTVPEDFRNRRIHRCWRMVRAGLVG
ncbi:MAG: bifunctional 23S rRNA (guanine(2069)-N(7))-methyltransferase RlmK/23S rRNA (guanine(2445)-N(2))-methyltransferase RlmL [Pirellulales bacterium]|nr:bifunctional 23S rRNA (guanine(2069)-N(7))-methyltransferase RlmK/23S rRNA (guanine(2445)-N(2))-methyltransferase RlmL [Pirellulales bacterium]